MSDLSRRDFLKIAGLGAAAAFAPSLRAQEEGERTRTRARPSLVTVFLRGGQDALNVLVPHGEKRYYELRPRIAIPAKDGDEGPGVLKLDSTFGLHPSLKALKPFWDAGSLAAIVAAGSTHNTRSHFDAQDFMEYAAPGNRTVRNGWLNRYLEATRRKPAERASSEVQLRAIAMQGLLPRALRGSFPALAIPEKNVLGRDKILDAFGEIYGAGETPMEGAAGRKEDAVLAVGKDTLEILKRYKEVVAKQKERDAKYPASRLGQKLRDIASVIHADAGLEIASVDVGGWDHHANEGGSTGAIANQLKDLGDSLAAFAQDMGPRFLSDTLVLVMTEFGRTCRENGTNGTDHGHGGCLLLLGGAVKGGKVHGRWSGLEDKDLYEGRDLPVTTDFRDVFAEVLRHHLKFEPTKDFFPDYKPTAVKGLF